jgi:hypothetical protein
MRASFNYTLFKQSDLDSAALTQLGQIIHPFAHPGAYRGTVWLGEEPVADFRLRVNDDAQAESDPVYVDLYGLHRRALTSRADESADTLEIGAGGYACFYLSWGEGGYAVTVEGAARPEHKGGAVADRPAEGDFDSRRLGAGDIFVATPLRPGSYQLVNREGDSTCSVIVRYPDPRQQRDPTATRPGEVACRDGGFVPEALSLLPAQGIIVRLETPAHLRLALKHPDHGPEDLRQLRARRQKAVRLRRRE